MESNRRDNTTTRRSYLETACQGAFCQGQRLAERVEVLFQIPFSRELCPIFQGFEGEDL